MFIQLTASVSAPTAISFCTTVIFMSTLGWSYYISACGAEMFNKLRHQRTSEPRPVWAAGGWVSGKNIAALILHSCKFQSLNFKRKEFQVYQVNKVQTLNIKQQNVNVAPPVGCFAVMQFKVPILEHLSAPSQEDLNATEKTYTSTFLFFFALL